MKNPDTVKKIILGGVLGLALLLASYFSLPSSILRRVAFWVFEANPILFVSCTIFKSGQCYGLGFDGGPLQWAEWVWFAMLPLVYACFGVAIVFLMLRITKKKKV